MDPGKHPLTRIIVILENYYEEVEEHVFQYDLKIYHHKFLTDYPNLLNKFVRNQIVLYLKEYKMTLYLDRTTLTLNRWILDNISVQCEVIGNEKLFKERLSKEDKKLKKIHEHLLKKRKI